jgi:FMN phosphatase YigB (HAD superfamily)
MTLHRIRALLFDLDDTLLLNDMEAFGAAYFRALATKLRPLCPPEVLQPALDEAVRAMWRNDGRNGTNAEVFAQIFFPRVGRTPEELMPLIHEFYTRDFEALRRFTAPDPEARALVSLAVERGYQLAVATQPVFPLPAILARLRWAGVGADEFPYAYISSYEEMRACKPHPHYFGTIVTALGRAPEECLMVGDSAETDLPARRYGLKTFWVRRGGQENTAEILCDAQGTLGDLGRLLETGGLDAL